MSLLDAIRRREKGAPMSHGRPLRMNAHGGSRGQICPSCGGDVSNVLVTRSVEGRQRRQRCCVGCGLRWRTYELTLAEIEAMIDAECDRRLVLIHAALRGTR